MVNFSYAITPTMTKAPTCNQPSSVEINDTAKQWVSISVGTTASVTTSEVPDFRFLPAGLPLLSISALLCTVLLCAGSRKRISAFSLSLVIMGTISQHSGVL